MPRDFGPKPPPGWPADRPWPPTSKADVSYLSLLGRDITHTSQGLAHAIKAVPGLAKEYYDYAQAHPIRAECRVVARATCGAFTHIATLLLCRSANSPTCDSSATRRTATTLSGHAVRRRASTRGFVAGDCVSRQLLPATDRQHLHAVCRGARNLPRAAALPLFLFL